MEIERKYAILFMPENISEYNYKSIEQGYLCNNPIVRIRKSNDDYYLTYKSKIGLEKNEDQKAIICNEIELPLTKEAYDHLKEKADGNIVYKTRYLIPICETLVAELDIFEHVLKGLVFVEVEFPDETMANNFEPPIWFGKELSSDFRFSNYYLSKISSYAELGL